jgi:hypothetical protein
MELSAVLTPATEGGYVAYNPETRRNSRRSRSNHIVIKVFGANTGQKAYKILEPILPKPCYP